MFCCCCVCVCVRFFLKAENDLTPLGSIRLDLCEVEFYKGQGGGGVLVSSSLPAPPYSSSTQVPREPALNCKGERRRIRGHLSVNRKVILYWAFSLSYLLNVVLLPGDADKWVADVRAVKQAHEKDPAVRGTLQIRVVEAKNLPSK